MAIILTQNTFREEFDIYLELTVVGDVTLHIGALSLHLGGDSHIGAS